MEFWITSMSSDGIISCLVNNMKYTYSIDTAHYPEILKLRVFKKGKALNLIKQKGTLLTKEKVK